jgi:hypothetical protein
VLELSNVLEPDAIFAVALYSTPPVAALPSVLDDCILVLIELTLEDVPSVTNLVVAILSELSPAV